MIEYSEQPKAASREVEIDPPSYFLIGTVYKINNVIVFFPEMQARTTLKCHCINFHMTLQN